MHPCQRDAQRCRTPALDILDDHHVGPVQRHRGTHRRRRTAQGEDQLVESGLPGNVEGGPKHRGIPIWQ
ncbi:Uncharacterised protein [Mycobacterium tuberculosis]|uniref:Uncharacterized protein n=1 Tax=Mycobacterium tuberculosis TaxID=1773 RepID=A0A916LCJ9_MYCTX|nr:Uncharacterised protein [Mycobacterium tuberculosis]CKS42145.1 Uncharacterised protein [Mycobacterium tuberculosis]CKT98995.1 Uncharacterised protein [Mycobacterium tuberculosis]COY68237.1 Uncharacterised protein [Mycobacterium tuberculosis]